MKKPGRHNHFIGLYEGMFRLHSLSIPFHFIIPRNFQKHHHYTANIKYISTSSFESNLYFQTLHAQRNTTTAGLNERQKSWVPQMDICGNMLPVALA
jgi:hypothetical protein